MKKVFLILCLLTGLTILVKGQDARLNFQAPGLEIDRVCLETTGQLIELPYDSTGIMSFSVKKFPAGYVCLQFGRVRKMLYLEKGKTAEVTYKRIRGSANSPYAYSGDLKAENSWLDANERRNPVQIKQTLTSADIIDAYTQEAELRKNEVISQGFSPGFTALESSRQAFSVYRHFLGFKGWDTSLYPFIRKNLTEVPGLLLCEDYYAFFLDALYTLARKDLPEPDLYESTLRQLQYIDTEIKDKDIADRMAASVITIYMEREGVNRIAPLMKIAQRNLQSPQQKEKVEAVYQKWAKMAQGTPCGNFTFRDIQGKQITLADFKGHYVFIDCWATWCGPCRQQLAPLRELEHRYEGKNIVFLSISSDEKQDKWKKFVAEQQLGGIQVIDPLPSAFATRFEVNGIPRFIILAPDGTIFHHNAPRPSDPDCRKLLDSVLK